jgi:Right handed beta helix region
MRRLSWQLAGSTVLVVLLGLLFVLAGPQLGADQEPDPLGGLAAQTRAAPGARCDLTGSPDGELQALLDRLAPGEVGCLRAGTYGFDIAIIQTAGVTLRPYEGEVVTLRGSLRVHPEGRGAVLEGLVLDGRSPATNDGPKIYASDVVLRNNEITNYNAGICIQVARFDDTGPRPTDVVIEHNRVHNCGTLPRTNQEHGIYIQDGLRTVVRGNWFYDNADRGIQQYPNAEESLITGNVIDGNGQGLNFSCDDSSCSRRNVVEGNVISNSVASWNVYGNSGGATPDGSNVLRGNCVWASNSDPYYNTNGGIDSDRAYFSEARNLIAAPRFVDRADKDFRLRSDSPCQSVLEG